LRRSWGTASRSIVSLAITGVVVSCVVVSAQAGEPFHGDVHHRVVVDRQRYDHNHAWDRVRRDRAIAETTVTEANRDNRQAMDNRQGITINNTANGAVVSAVRVAGDMSMKSVTVVRAVRSIPCGFLPTGAARCLNRLCLQPKILAREEAVRFCHRSG
jgi:hypothetical protein